MHKKALNLPISVASQLEIAPRSCVAHTTAEVLCIPSTPWHNEVCTQFSFLQLQNDDERPFGTMKFHLTKICTVHIYVGPCKKLGKTVNITMKWWSKTRPKPVYNMPMPDSTSSISWKSKMWLSKHQTAQNHWFFRFLRWINMSLIGMWNLEKPEFTVKNTPYQWNRRFFFKPPQSLGSNSKNHLLGAPHRCYGATHGWLRNGAATSWFAVDVVFCTAVRCIQIQYHRYRIGLLKTIWM